MKSISTLNKSIKIMSDKLKKSHEITKKAKEKIELDKLKNK